MCHYPRQALIANDYGLLLLSGMIIVPSERGGLLGRFVIRRQRIDHDTSGWDLLAPPPVSLRKPGAYRVVVRNMFRLARALAGMGIR